MADEAPMTKPPATDETGVALEGGYPHNHRLRAEALAKDGKTSDPSGAVSDDLIKDAGERLERDAKAAADAERAATTDLRKMTTAQLVETATGEGVDLSAANTNPERVSAIEAHRKAASEGKTAGDAGKGEGA